MQMISMRWGRAEWENAVHYQPIDDLYFCVACVLSESRKEDKFDEKSLEQI